MEYLLTGKAQDPLRWTHNVSSSPSPADPSCIPDGMSAAALPNLLWGSGTATATGLDGLNDPTDKAVTLSGAGGVRSSALVYPAPTTPSLTTSYTASTLAQPAASIFTAEGDALVSGPRALITVEGATGPAAVVELYTDPGDGDARGPQVMVRATAKASNGTTLVVGNDTAIEPGVWYHIGLVVNAADESVHLAVQPFEDGALAYAASEDSLPDTPGVDFVPANGNLSVGTYQSGYVPAGG